MNKLATMLVTLALFTGCGKSAKKDDHDDHEHKPGPHGGTIFDLGKGKDLLHLEFTVDHKTKEVKIYVLGKDQKTPTPIKADELTLIIKKPAFEVKLKPEKQKDDPEGKYSVYSVKHENFGKEQEFEGRVEAMIDGTQTKSDPFKEEEHDHDKK